MVVSPDARLFRHFGSTSDSIVNDFEDLFALGSGEGKSRGTDPFGTEATYLDSEFDVLNELNMDIEMKQRGEPAIDFACLVPFARAGQIPAVLIFSGECDATAGDPTVDAENGAFENEVINTGKDGVAIANEGAN